MEIAFFRDWDIMFVCETTTFGTGFEKAGFWNIGGSPRHY